MTKKHETSDATIPARQRLMAAASEQFSKKGFGGASIRQICLQAGTSSNMVHHYFGSKQGLYDEILAGFTQDVWQVPARIISKSPRSQEHLMSLMEVFIEETMEALIEHRHIYRLVVRELMVFDTFEEYHKQLVRFLNDAKELGFVRAETDPDMLTGLILDRLGNQILFASWIEETQGVSVITDQAYKTRWIKANMDLIFYGIMR